MKIWQVGISLSVFLLVAVALNGYLTLECYAEQDPGVLTDADFENTPDIPEGYSEVPTELTDEDIAKLDALGASPIENDGNAAFDTSDFEPISEQPAPFSGVNGKLGDLSDLGFEPISEQPKLEKLKGDVFTEMGLEPIKDDFSDLGAEPVDELAEGLKGIIQYFRDNMIQRLIIFICVFLIIVSFVWWLIQRKYVFVGLLLLGLAIILLNSVIFQMYLNFYGARAEETEFYLFYLVINWLGCFIGLMLYPLYKLTVKVIGLAKLLISRIFTILGNNRFREWRFMIPSRRFWEIGILLLVIACLLYALFPKFTYFHPQGKQYIIRCNKFTGAMDKQDFSDISKTKSQP